MLQVQFRHLRNVVAVDPAPDAAPDQNAVDCNGYSTIVVTVDRECTLVPYWWNDCDEVWHRGGAALEFSEAV